jgi:GNAT superfamily N-acetyltransferase
VVATDAVVWQLGPADANEAGALLGRAFADEPVFQAVCESEDIALALCTDTFIANFRHATELGEAWAVGTPAGGMVGAAYTVLKPEPDLTDAQQRAFGYDALMARWGRYLEPIGAMEATALSALGDMGKGWRYLSGIGVDPTVQGKGYGSVLMESLVSRARAAGERFALVTDRPINVPFYEKFGFQVVSPGNPASASVQFWRMVLAE